MATTNAAMKQRRDSAADWTSNDPTLADGELGVESDTGRLKIGDGATAWTALGYLNAAADAVSPVQLRYDPVDTRWEDASGGEYNQAARAALRPHPIYWLCDEGDEPVWGSNDYDANEAYGDLVHVIAAP